jgi:hypothetical protein
MKEYTISLEEKISIIESKLSCIIGMKETVEYDLTQEEDSDIRIELEGHLVDCKNIIIALENFRETMVE